MDNNNCNGINSTGDNKASKGETVHFRRLNEGGNDPLGLDEPNIKQRLQGIGAEIANIKDCSREILEKLSGDYYRVKTQEPEESPITSFDFEEENVSRTIKVIQDTLLIIRSELNEINNSI